jgi:hypothetical protein
MPTADRQTSLATPHTLADRQLRQDRAHHAAGMACKQRAARSLDQINDEAPEEQLQWKPTDCRLPFQVTKVRNGTLVGAMCVHRPTARHKISANSVS